MPITFRPGLRPNDPSRQRIRLTDHLDVEAVLSAPPAANWDARVNAFGMLGNADWGDCAEAASLHALQAITAAAGSPIVPTDADAIGAYSALTGFDPNAGPPGKNPTDQGTVLQDLLDYWRKTGLTVGGKVHKILAFAQVDHTSPLELRAAIALFGAVIYGIQVPRSAEEEFNAGEPWDYVPGSPNLGGHAITDERYDQALWYPVTWGREQPATEAFMTAYLQEAWVPILPEWLEANGATPSGLNRATLGADFTALTGEPAPWATPPAPKPTPTPAPVASFPGALVAAVQAAAADPKVSKWLGEHHLLTPDKAAAAHLAAILAAPRS